MRLRRRLLRGLMAACALAAIAPTAHAQSAGIPVLVLDGKGFGHGVGLSQWGAMYMAQGGADHEDILSTFYPDTGRGSVGDPDVRVSVLTAPNGQTTLTFPDGGDVRSALSGEQDPGFPVVVAPGGSVRITFDGSTYHVDPIVSGQAASRAAAWHAPASATSVTSADDSCIPVFGPCQPGCALGCDTTTTVPPSTSAPPPDTSAPGTDGGNGSGVDDGGATPTQSSAGAESASPVWAVPTDGSVIGVLDRDRRYRGYLEAIADGGNLRLLNQVDVDTYLEGMGEMPGDWPFEALAAQAVVARTYALRAMSASGELCDYDLCQVYVGADQESANQNAAVGATSGEVVTYAGGLASTVYSADAGGVSATPHEGFGATDDGAYPYLTTVRYETPNPLPWHVEVALSDLAGRLGYPGTLASVAIKDSGPSGRALDVALDGDHGESIVDGRDFARSLGLRSTLFTPSLTNEDTAPPPPAPATDDAQQALPDNAAALQRAARAAPAAAASRFRAVTNAVALAAPAGARPRRATVDVARLMLTTVAVATIGLVVFGCAVELDVVALRRRRDRSRRGAPSR